MVSVKLSPFLLLLLVYCFVLARPSLPQTSGETQPLSPNSGLSSNNSAEHLTAWNRLSEQFSEALYRHEATLEELSGKLETSEANGKLLTGLLDRLSRQNEDLRNYNDQIGDRMRERDEDLAEAYDRVDRLEKRRLKALIAIIIMAAVILGYIAVKVFRVFRVMP
jgi:hypothetical protein